MRTRWMAKKTKPQHTARMFSQIRRPKFKFVNFDTVSIFFVVWVDAQGNAHNNLWMCGKRSGSLFNLRVNAPQMNGRKSRDFWRNGERNVCFPTGIHSMRWRKLIIFCFSISCLAPLCVAIVGARWMCEASQSEMKCGRSSFICRLHKSLTVSDYRPGVIATDYHHLTKSNRCLQDRHFSKM